MIIHALQIIRKELDDFLNSFGEDESDKVQLGNIAQLELLQQTEIKDLKDKVVITLVGTREEKTLKNGPFSRRNDTTLRTEYFNPPLYLNLYLLISVSQSSYTNALIYLSRVVSFFQGKSVFTHENTTPITSNVEVPITERMQEFKLLLEMYNPSFEEQNHIWGTLGGKQIPSVMYLARLVEIKQALAPKTGGLVEEIQLNSTIKMQ